MPTLLQQPLPAAANFLPVASPGGGHAYIFTGDRCPPFRASWLPPFRRVLIPSLVLQTGAIPTSPLHEGPCPRHTRNHCPLPCASRLQGPCHRFSCLHQPRCLPPRVTCLLDLPGGHALALLPRGGHDLRLLSTMAPAHASRCLPPCASCKTHNTPGECMHTPLLQDGPRSLSIATAT